jgi:hypothetical protein
MSLVVMIVVMHIFVKKKFVELLKEADEFYEKLSVTIRSLSVDSRSLLHEIDSNVVEQFHSIVGGKRINYSKGRSYRARYHAAVVLFNTKRPHYSLHKTIVGKSPLKIKQRFELRRRDKIKRQLTYAKIYKKKSDQVEDKDYGVFCQRADMDPDVFEAAKSSFIKSLEKDEEERKFFEENTKLQSGSGDWLRMRRKLLTASNFQKVCRRRRTTSCVNLVRDIIYSNHHSHYRVCTVPCRGVLIRDLLTFSLVNCWSFLVKFAYCKDKYFFIKYFSLLSNLLGVETLAALGRLLSSLLLLIAFFAITATLSIFKFVFAELVGFLAC